MQPPNSLVRPATVAVAKFKTYEKQLDLDLIVLFFCTSSLHNTEGGHRIMMIYGYARVSTDGQSIAAQVDALTAAGAGKIFKEVASGAKTDRAQLQRLLKLLDEGDVMLVTRLDRLARSTRDLLNTLAAITGSKAGFRSLGDTWADTTTAHGCLMLTVLGGLAEFERELIRARTGEGRARAKARGQSLGRPFSLTPHQRQEVLARRQAGELLSEIARSYNVSAATICRVTQ